MGKPIPTADEVAQKWKTRGSGAQTEYVNKAKVSTWKTEAVAGEDNFNKSMQQVLANKSRQKGIEKVSDTDWQSGIEKNAGRYSQGINDSVDKMSAGIGNVLNDIKAVVPTLGKRGPKGSAENYQRSQKVGQALHDAAMKRKS
jgi:hypothetical protein